MSRRFSNFQWFVATVVILLVAGLLCVSPARAVKPVQSMLTTQGSCINPQVSGYFNQYVNGSVPPDCTNNLPLGGSGGNFNWTSSNAANSTVVIAPGSIFHTVGILSPSAVTGSLSATASILSPGGVITPFASGVTSFSVCPGENHVMVPLVRTAEAMFSTNDRLSVMLEVFGMFPPGSEVTFGNSCYLTSPLFDPPWPGQTSEAVPTVSEWGMLILALFLAGISVLVIRRRLKIGR